MITKTNTRKLYKAVRNSLTTIEKSECDNRIFSHFVNSDISDRYDLYLVYVSVGSEADTLNIIDYLLNNNKKVAVPVCDDTDMDFYEIKSLNELYIGKFGIPTVDVSSSSKIINFENTLCLVPGVCFDNFGYRIGYGGGYYDRFLSENPVKSVGLCYERCICNLIPNESFDKPVDFILSEYSLRNSKSKEVSTYE